MLVAEELIAAFTALFPTSSKRAKRFGSASLGWLGVCDGAAGVQWNAWVNFKDDAAYVGVNLEGMKYDGWPIARFIEAELEQPKLFEVIPILQAPEQIQLIAHRDAWQFSSRPQIEEKLIGLSERCLPQIDKAGWRRTLLEAYDCLDAEGHRHRGKQTVTTKRGRVEMDVSPHLQFRQRISSSPAAVRDWGSLLARATESLRPVHDYMKQQSAASSSGVR